MTSEERRAERESRNNERAKLRGAAADNAAICPARSKSLNRPSPHFHTSVLDMGVEFYPCVCGRPWQPGTKAGG